MEELRRGINPRQRARTLAALLFGVPMLLIALLLTHAISDASAGELHIAAGSATPGASIAEEVASFEPGPQCSQVCGGTDSVIELLCAVLLAALGLMPFLRRRVSVFGSQPTVFPVVKNHVARSGWSSVSLAVLSISRT